MKVLVFYTKNEDLDCIFRFLETDDKMELDQIFEIEPCLKKLEYQEFEPDNLPPKKYVKGLKGTKKKGVWLDEAKYLEKSGIKEQKIKALKSKTTQIIYAEYDEIKQRNTALGIYNDTKKQEIIDFIKTNIAECDVKEQTILEAQTIEALESIEV
ncbi:MAG: hypothetical protein GY817_04710 [bacterium]|nr:hypothetical protein [bacterium]